MYQTLAVKEGLGRVVICKDCSDVHLAVDNISMRIDKAAFAALGDMIQEALRHPKLTLVSTDGKEFFGQRLFSLA